MIQSKQVNSEVLALLKQIPLKNYLKIPDKEISYLKANQDENYFLKYNKNSPIYCQDVSREALIIFIKLYVTYIANTNEQESIRAMLNLNDLKQEVKKSKYNTSNIFKSKKNNYSNILPVEINKNGFFHKTFSIIKSLYYKLIKKT